MKKLLFWVLTIEELTLNVTTSGDNLGEKTFILNEPFTTVR